MHSSFVRGGGASEPDRRRSGAPLDVRLDKLRGAVEIDQDPQHKVARRAVLELLDRADRAGSGGHAELWDLFADAALGLVGEERWAFRVAVTANLIGIVDIGDADDFVTAAPFLFLYTSVLVLVFGPGTLSLDHVVALWWRKRSKTAAPVAPAAVSTPTAAVAI